MAPTEDAHRVIFYIFHFEHRHISYSAFHGEMNTIWLLVENPALFSLWSGEVYSSFTAIVWKENEFIKHKEKMFVDSEETWRTRDTVSHNNCTHLYRMQVNFNLIDSFFKYYGCDFCRVSWWNVSCGWLLYVSRSYWLICLKVFIKSDSWWYNRRFNQMLYLDEAKLLQSPHIILLFSPHI